MGRQDLIRMCMQNLLRRKSRTLLTVLGVLIGCCAIVIMVSIGIGMKESQDKLLSEMGDLTIITVYPQSRGKQGKKLDDGAVRSFGMLEHVEAATPKLSPDDFTLRLYAGEGRRFMADYASACGMDIKAVDGLGYSLLSGRYPQPLAEGEALAGQYLEYAFQDTMRPEGYNTVDLYSMYQDDGTVGEPPPAYFNAMEGQLTLEVAYGEAAPVTLPISIAGRVKEDYSKGYETSQGLIMDIKLLQNAMNQAKQAAGVVAGPPKGYETVLVKVSGIDQVAEVEKQIKQMGFQTSSMESIRQPMEKEARQKQLMLGGLGAISLFVAALGITNTMIMSISERTREIGIMKSLGCYVRDIRGLFLLEAGSIGLIGGVAGCIISLLASWAMNLISTSTPIASLGDVYAVLSTPGSRLSVVPPWLLAFAILFSILIGLGSGYYPANKAVRIPALEAIKSD